MPAAILFPVLARALEAPRQSSCVSNLKQPGTAMQMYTQDLDEMQPGAAPVSAASPYGHWVLAFNIGAGQNAAQPGPFLVDQGAIYPYVKWAKRTQMTTLDWAYCGSTARLTQKRVFPSPTGTPASCCGGTDCTPMRSKTVRPRKSPSASQLRLASRNRSYPPAKAASHSLFRVPIAYNSIRLCGQLQGLRSNLNY